MPDRWDDEAKAVTCGCSGGLIGGLDWDRLDDRIAALARRAYREGLERARGLALDIAGEYPEDIFRPIEPGELTDAGSLGDRIGAHMARIAARNIAAAIRREIEGG